MISQVKVCKFVGLDNFLGKAQQGGGISHKVKHGFKNIVKFMK